MTPNEIKAKFIDERDRIVYEGNYVVYETSFRDKTGKKLYGGDVVRVQNGWLTIVSNDGHIPTVNDLSLRIVSTKTGRPATLKIDVKKLGNIFTDPKLLQEVLDQEQTYVLPG